MVTPEALIWSIVFLTNIFASLAQIGSESRWCLVNAGEMQKCQAMLSAVAARANRPYPPGYATYDQLPKLSCIQGNDPYDCMNQIATNVADLMQLEPGWAYTAGEYSTMMPLMAEKYTTGTQSDGLSYYSVAVVRKDRPELNINTLQGTKACITGVGRAEGWVYPISLLVTMGIMPIVECNVPVKSAASFFGDTCAPDALNRLYNPFGNNPTNICKNCQSQNPRTFCTSNDQYAGYFGAFDCMASRRGDVAFVRNFTILEYTNMPNSTSVPDDFELLCLDGTRAAYDQAANCHWGVINSHVVMTSALRDPVLRAEYKSLLSLLSYDFGVGGNNTDLFQLFSSVAYGIPNAMFTDAGKQLWDVGSRDSYYSWVGEDFRTHLVQLNTCPLQTARWCVVSKFEMSKCEDMIMAFAAKNLKPDLNCIQGTDVRDCMNKIQMGDADLITLDAADVYIAGKFFSLVPIASEDYSGTGTGTYFAVAVARKTDSHLTIFNLKNRRGCHSAVMSAAGWIIPVDVLIQTMQIHIDNCNPYFSVGQFFSKSCVPGALDDVYNALGTNPVNLCEACAMLGTDRCSRNDVELYYGNSGAFRCLVEKGGDVAFVKHTSPRENTDGRNQADWARNRRADDYELLCNDGTRGTIDAWATCNMGTVPTNAIVTADFKSQQDREIFWTLLNYAQQFFASDSNPDFLMFGSTIFNHKDLIFQDATVRLVPVDPATQDYVSYLGDSFIRSMERMASYDCVTSDTIAAASWRLAPFSNTVFVFVCSSVLLLVRLVTL